MTNRDAQGRFAPKFDSAKFDERVTRLEKTVKLMHDMETRNYSTLDFVVGGRSAGKSYAFADSNYAVMKNSRDHWLNVSKGRFARIQDLEYQLASVRDENRELAKLVSKTNQENLAHRYPKVDRVRDDARLVRSVLSALNDATVVSKRLTSITIHVEYSTASSAAHGCQVLNDFTGVSATRVGFGRRRMIVEFE